MKICLFTSLKFTTHLFIARIFFCSYGEWSRVGCRTELDENWFAKRQNGALLVNCTCNHLSTFAVLVDVVDLEVSEKKMSPSQIVLIIFFRFSVHTRAIAVGRRNKLQLFHNFTTIITRNVFDSGVY